jgi:histidyl-tRNA synthetase
MEPVIAAKNIQKSWRMYNINKKYNLTKDVDSFFKMFSNCEKLEKMFEKIHNSNLNELLVQFIDNSFKLNKVRFIYNEKDNYEVIDYLENSLLKLNNENAKEKINTIAKSKLIVSINLEGFIVFDSLYKYPEFFSISIV